MELQHDHYRHWTINHMHKDLSHLKSKISYLGRPNRSVLIEILCGYIGTHSWVAFGCYYLELLSFARGWSCCWLFIVDVAIWSCWWLGILPEKREGQKAPELLLVAAAGRNCLAAVAFLQKKREEEGKENNREKTYKIIKLQDYNWK